MKKIIRNSRKGVTMAELVIALGIIIIIMIASISMLKSSVSIGIKTSAVVEANHTVESIVECFNYSKSKTDFKNHLKNLHGKFKEDTRYGGAKDTQYIIDCGSYTIEINYIEYSATGNSGKASYAMIEINAYLSDKGKTKINKEEIIYYKGL